MKLLNKLILFFPLLIFAMGVNGCIEKAVFPAANISVEKVTPDKLRVASATIITLPGTVVTLTSNTSIPANLESFSISYTTRLGEPIPQIAVPETALNLKLPTAATTDVSMNPYSSRLYALFSLTVADISPVNAKMVFTIKDVNNNTTQVEANCTCYAKWDELAP